MFYMFLFVCISTSAGNHKILYSSPLFTFMYFNCFGLMSVIIKVGIQIGFSNYCP